MGLENTTCRWLVVLQVKVSKGHVEVTSPNEVGWGEKEANIRTEQENH